MASTTKKPRPPRPKPVRSPDHADDGRFVVWAGDRDSKPGQRYFPEIPPRGKRVFIHRSPKLIKAYDLGTALRFADRAAADAWVVAHLFDFEPINLVVVDLDDLGV